MSYLDQVTRLNSRVKTKIAPSKIAGVGVFALRDIAKGESLYADALPEVYSVSYTNLNKLFPAIRELILERNPMIVNGESFPYPSERIQAFVNHSESANYDAFGDVMLRDVSAGEEITENYKRISGWEKVYPWLLSPVVDKEP